LIVGPVLKITMYDEKAGALTFHTFPKEFANICAFYILTLIDSRSID